MRRDDRDDPFDEFFREIERMMNQMMGGRGEFRFEHDSNVGGTGGVGDVHFDVHEADDEVRVVADIPGIEKEAIDLKCDGRTLTVDASGDQREYHEQVSLPATVDEHAANATYNNGILEVTFEQADDSTSIDL